MSARTTRSRQSTPRSQALLGTRVNSRVWGSRRLRNDKLGAMPHRLLLILLLLLPSGLASDKPNILFIAVDDLNDWVGCLGGHPQAKTPNIDALARKGVLFANAHCAAPLCNPSRTALMFGKRPTTTGVVGNGDDWRTFETLENSESLPEFFRRNGYFTAAAGKIFHANHGGWKRCTDPCRGGAFCRTQRIRPAFRHGTSDFLPRPSNFRWHRCLIGYPPQRDQSSLGLGADRFQGRRYRRRTDLRGGLCASCEPTHDRPFFLAVRYIPPARSRSIRTERILRRTSPWQTVELPTILSTSDLDDVPEIAKRYTKAPQTTTRR